MTDAVPATLTETVALTSAKLAAFDVKAAWWSTTSTPRRALARASVSRTSPHENCAGVRPS